MNDKSQYQKIIDQLNKEHEDTVNEIADQIDYINISCQDHDGEYRDHDCQYCSYSSAIAVLISLVAEQKVVMSNLTECVLNLKEGIDERETRN